MLPNDDERLMDAFRDQLRDAQVNVVFHGTSGEPLPGKLELQQDKTTLVWTNTNRFRHFQPRQAEINLSDVCAVREGRQTTNLIRTIKYITPEQLPHSDDCCLSLLSPIQIAVRKSSTASPIAASNAPLMPGSAAALYSFDMEFEDAATRNQALSYFLAEANLSGTIDLYNDASDIALPRGWSTRCYQLVSHPSFDVLVFIVVVVNMVFIALRPFILDGDDDSALLVNTKPKMTENLSPLEVALLILLTVEQLAKIVGLEGLRPLLQRKWDAFDLLVVLISWVSFIPSSTLSGFNMLSLRLLRGVRLFKHWKGFQEVVETFLLTLPMAANAVLCYGYYLFLFAILGMYLFNDSLEYRCAVAVASPSTSAMFSPSTVKEYAAAVPIKYCSMQDSSTCKAPHECIAMPAPNNGYTGFHSFQASFLTVFLISLRSGFGSAIDGAMQATSFFAIVYFIGLMVFVSYMILSLFVGIVRGSYIEVTIHSAAKQEEQKKMMELYEKKNRIQFPSATKNFPDLVAVLWAKWRGYRIQVRDQVLHSPLFATNEHEDTFLSRIRLHREQVFYLIDPNGDFMARLCAICDSAIFEHFMNVVVFMNSVLFAMEYHGMSHEYANKLYTAENMLILVYAAEFFIVCGSSGGLVGYLKSPWNRLDFVILTCAFIEFFALITSLVLYSDTYTRAIFVLRLFRLVRPFRVIRKKNELLHVLDAVIASVPAFLSLVAFHVLLNSLFAIVGMNLFGGKFPLSMRSHFNTFGDSMLTLFKISCGGDTWKVFFASLNASSFGVALAFYMTYFILCIYIVLNFMLVVLLRNFAMKEDEKKKTLSNIFQDRMLTMQRVHHFDEYSFLQDFSDLYQSDIMYATLSGSAEKRAKIEMSTTEEMTFRLLKILPTADFLKIKGYSQKSVGVAGSGSSVGGSSARVKYTRLDNPVSPVGRRSVGFADFSTGNSTSQEDFGPGIRGRIRRFFSGEWITADVSLFLFPLHSRFRLKCKRLEKETDKFIFTCIVIRTVLLVLQSPVYGNLIQEFNTLVDVLFACVLLFEFIIKVVARGFLLTPNSYLSTPMNQMNMVVLMGCSLLLLLPRSTMVTLFRFSRAFGPVRVFYRVKMFRVIIEALKQSLRQIFYCVVITLFLFYSFATLGMQFFAGKFSFCNDPSVSSHVECEGFFWNTKSGILMPRVWGNLAGMHFDNISGAMGSIFVLVTKKGWLPVLNLAMDIVGGEHQPVQNASAYFALFFVVVIFITRFYILKVFAGIIMNNFRCYNGTLLLNNLQLIWMRNKHTIIKMKPKYPLPENKFILQAQIFVQTRAFRMFTSCIVMIHVILLAWYRSPVGRDFIDELNDDLNGVDSTQAERGVWSLHYVFAMIYAIDATMCVVSMGWKDFLMKGFTWRTTNTVTAFIMLVGPSLTNSPVLLVLGMTRAFDFKHISLVFERFYSIRTLFETLLASVRLTLKVSLLLGYVLFVFATVGMQIFSLTRWGYGLDSNLNYLTFPTAFTAFVKFTAGEDWYDTYHSSAVQPPNCVSSGSWASARYASDCGSPALSSIFYHTFYVLVTLVLQNLYVATMVDTYVSTSAVGENREESLQMLGFRSDDLKHFQSVWSLFDPEAFGYLHRKHLLSFLSQLDQPLGLGKARDMVTCVLAQMDPDEVTSAVRARVELQVHRKRKELFQDIEARVCELILRLRIIHDDHMGVDFTCPPSMIKFTDLIVVLTSRIVPLESLTVQDKVDELAVRGYVRRHRSAIKIQSAFRMFRIRRRKTRRRARSRLESGQRTDETLEPKPAPVHAASESEAAQPVKESRSRRASRALSMVLPAGLAIDIESLSVAAEARLEESILATLPGEMETVSLD